MKCQLLFALLVCLAPPDMHLDYVKSEFTVDCKASTDFLPSRFIPVDLSGSILTGNSPKIHESKLNKYKKIQYCS